MIGEYERAFCGGQYASMASLSEHYGVQLWTPEVGGRIDFHVENHEQAMLALGYQPKREIARKKLRVRAAMAARLASKAATWRLGLPGDKALDLRSPAAVSATTGAGCDYCLSSRPLLAVSSRPSRNAAA